LKPKANDSQGKSNPLFDPQVRCSKVEGEWQIVEGLVTGKVGSREVF